MIIYKTTNLINGKIYVGQDCNNNSEYLGSGKILKQSIIKYGIENFKKETLEICVTKKELNEREIYWINELSAITIGYNIALGGTGGDLFNCLSEEDKYKNRLIKSENAKIKNVMNDKNVFDCWVEKYGIEMANKKLLDFKNKLIKTLHSKKVEKEKKINDDYGSFIIESFKVKTIDEIHIEMKGVVSKQIIRNILKKNGVDVYSRKDINFAENNGMSKLTCEQVKEIRTLKHIKLNKEIAKIYGISNTQIGLILRNISYKSCQ